MSGKVISKSIMRDKYFDHHDQLLFRQRLHHNKRSSTLVTEYFSVISFARKSIKKCHRRLLEFFSNLKGVRPRGQGFVILQQEEVDENGCRPRIQLEFEADFDLPDLLVLRERNRKRMLPPLDSEKSRTIVLDLDETLVHSSLDPPPKMYDFMIEPSICGLRMKFYVLKRLGVDEFLEAMSKKYELVVFTAGLEEYASLLLDVLDPKGLISHRLYRDSCKQISGGRFVKDLSRMGRHFQKVVIVDDNPKSYVLQPANAIPIKRFEDDMEDRELEKLRVFLERHCDGFEDMRDAVKQYLNGDDHSYTMRQPQAQSLLDASSSVII